MGTIPLLAAMGVGGPELLLIVLMLALFAFWVRMIVDCAMNETGSGTKIAGILVIILVGVIGAPLYFFVRKVPRKNS